MSIIEYIDQAIAEGNDITIRYVKSDGTLSERTLSNAQYSDEYGDEYISGYCHFRNENRTFKISRIREIKGVPGLTQGSAPTSTKTAYITKTAYTGSTISPSSTYTYRAPSPAPKTSYSSQPRTSYTPTPPKRKEGCYIATMAYGDYDHPQVIILRRFRDERLLPTAPGRVFVKFYYWISPKLVIILRGHDRINQAIRHILDGFLDRIIKSTHGLG